MHDARAPVSGRARSAIEDRGGRTHPAHLLAGPVAGLGVAVAAVHAAVAARHEGRVGHVGVAAVRRGGRGVHGRGGGGGHGTACVRHVRARGRVRGVVVPGRDRHGGDLARGDHGHGAGDDLRRGGTGKGQGGEDGVHVDGGNRTAGSRDGPGESTLVANEW